LTDRVLDGWKAAVEEFLPADGTEQRVLDLGAGTGIFSRTWPMWRRCQVIAVEPSEAMRTEMVRTGLPDRVHVVGAVAENLHFKPV
jgi:predicted RNA methylase